MTRLTNIFMIVNIGIIALFGLGCPDEIQSPIVIPPTPNNCEYPPGNRNFTWRLDTIAWWPSTLGGIHAFSDSDTWVMGSMLGPNVNGQNSSSYVALHWDGTSWDQKVEFANLFIEANDVAGDDNFMVGAGMVRMPDGNMAVVSEFNNISKKWKTVQFQTKGELRTVWTDRKGFFITAGDNGMIYTKDGYTAEWVYQKAPTDFNIIKVEGISKTEIYALTDKAIPGKHYQQLWKLRNNDWTKLCDNMDTTGSLIRLAESTDNIYNFSVVRCSISDSLYLYLAGDQSYGITSFDQSLSFHQVNLSTRGLPLSAINIAASNIKVFSPNDYWISSGWYHLYHWDGSNYQKVEPILGLPYGQLWGVTSKIIKGKTGKLWILLEMNSQVYSIIQGIPK